MKVLIIRSGAIGDVLMTTPLIRGLKQNIKNLTLDYFVGSWSSVVLKDNKNIDNIYTFSEKKLFINKNYLYIIKQILFLRSKKYDIILVLDKHKMASLFAMTIGGKRYGFDRYGDGRFNHKNISYKGGKHEILYYLDILKLFNIDYNNTKMDLKIGIEDIKKISNIMVENEIKKENTICIAPGGANNPAVGDDDLRRWQLDNYISLSKLIIDKGYNIVLIGGKNDFLINEKLKNSVNHKRVLDFAGKLSITESAELIKQSNVFICNDSGPMHIAGSVNDKIISIFGPTVPFEKAPLHKKSFFFWKNEYGCVPCYDLWGNFPKCSSKKCMSSVTVKEVFEKVLELMN